MQFGCGDEEEIIHVSAHPVTPSLGETEPTCTFPSDSTTFWFAGHAVPATMSPESNASTSSVQTFQYLLINGFCCLRRLIAASSWSDVSSYGSVIFSSGVCALGYMAASAM